MMPAAELHLRLPALIHRPEARSGWHDRFVPTKDLLDSVT
jgi:hypothetical protein